MKDNSNCRLYLGNWSFEWELKRWFVHTNFWGVFLDIIIVNRNPVVFLLKSKINNEIVIYTNLYKTGTVFFLQRFKITIQLKYRQSSFVSSSILQIIKFILIMNDTKKVRDNNTLNKPAREKQQKPTIWSKAEWKDLWNSVPEIIMSITSKRSNNTIHFQKNTVSVQKRQSPQNIKSNLLNAISLNHTKSVLKNKLETAEAFNFDLYLAHLFYFNENEFLWRANSRYKYFTIFPVQQRMVRNKKNEWKTKDELRTEKFNQLLQNKD